MGTIMLKKRISQLWLKLGFEVTFYEYFGSLFISFRGTQLAEFSLSQLKDGFKAVKEAYLYRAGVKSENLFFYYLNWGLYTDSELELNNIT